LTRILAGRRVFVTGHTGFKGAWLSAWLHMLGAEVTGYALPPERDEDLFNVFDLKSRLTHIEGDVRDLPRLAKAIRSAKSEIVFHLAAQPLVRRSYAEPHLTFDTNVMGSVNLLEAVRNCGSALVLIYVTSDKCYRDNNWTWGYRENDALGGHDPYSASKACAELVFASYQQSYFAQVGLRAGSVRAGNVIGGGDWAADRIVPDCIRALLKGDPINIRSPQSVRPWQHVLEPLFGYITLAGRMIQANDAEASLLAGQAWNYGPPHDSHRTVAELVQLLTKNWGGGEVRVTPDSANWKETATLYLNCEKSQHHLGWRPCWDFEGAVQTTVDWYRQCSQGANAWQLSTQQISSYMKGQA
jgi:CDP-glucose 4,6-dehydratase